MSDALGIIVMILALDAYLYFIHRALHHFPMLWAVHKSHHAAYAPSFHVAEFALLWLVPLTVAWATGHALAMFIVGFMFVFEVGVTHRANYKTKSKLHRWIFIKTRRFLSNACYHKRHHDNPEKNYAQLFTFWDSICGTKGVRG